MKFEVKDSPGKTVDWLKEKGLYNEKMKQQEILLNAINSIRGAIVLIHKGNEICGQNKSPLDCSSKVITVILDILFDMAELTNDMKNANTLIPVALLSAVEDSEFHTEEIFENLVSAIRGKETEFSEDEFGSTINAMVREIGTTSALQELLNWSFSIVAIDAGEDLDQKAAAMEKFKSEICRVLDDIVDGYRVASGYKDSVRH